MRPRVSKYEAAHCAISEVYTTTTTSTTAAITTSATAAITTSTTATTICSRPSHDKQATRMARPGREDVSEDASRGGRSAFACGNAERHNDQAMKGEYGRGDKRDERGR